VLVGIVSWLSQEYSLGLIKASKEVNNLSPPPKDLGGLSNRSWSRTGFVYQM